jgi:integrase
VLLRRGKIYYCRVWVPLELRNLLGRAELKKSLHTANRTEAKTAAVALIHKTETAFFRMRVGMLTNKELEVLTAELIGDFTGVVEEFRGQRKKVDDFILTAKIPIGLDINFGGYELIDSILNYSRSREDVKTLEDRFKCIDNGLENELQTGCFSDETRWLARKLIRDQGLDVVLPPDDWFNINEDSWSDEPPADFGRLCETVVHAMRYNYSVAAEIGLSQKDTPRQHRIASIIEAAKPKPKLSDLWTAYCKAKLAKKSWRVKTAKKNQDTYDEAIKILGDRELTDYSQELVNTYSIMLQKINSAGTVTGKLELFSSIFKYALENAESQELWKIRGNPFSKKQVTDNVPASEKKRRPYTTEDLHYLMSGLLKVRKLVEPHRFFVPLIALYSGMRQEEICQLRCADIDVEDKIDIFRIKHCPEHRQEVKARNVRTCPVHPMLKALGFMAYVEQQRNNKQDRLFSTLDYNTKGWTGKIRSWWNEQFQKKHVKDTVRKSFHSLRGTMINQFKQQGLYKNANDRMVMQSMIGHEDDDVTGVHYEENYPITEKYKLMRKLNFGINPALVEALAQKPY